MKKVSSLEPRFDSEPSPIQMTESFNWYGANHSWADSKTYLLDYLKTNGLNSQYNILKKGHEADICWACGWIARMLLNGSKVTLSAKQYLEDYIKGIS